MAYDMIQLIFGANVPRKMMQDPTIILVWLLTDNLVDAKVLQSL